MREYFLQQTVIIVLKYAHEVLFFKKKKSFNYKLLYIFYTKIYGNKI